MKKFTLDSLRQFRNEQKKTDVQGSSNIKVIVGMGTCGIAAGAKDALNVFLGEAYIRKIDNLHVHQTGCMGLCHAEPTVEVIMDGMPNTLYGKVDGNAAKRIVADHILEKRLVHGLVYEYPAPDICKED